MSTGKIILSIVVILIVFLIGGGAGIMYQAQKTITPTTQVQTIPPIVKQLSSKVVPSIAVYGKVTDINGRNVTVSYDTDNITIKIKDGAPVVSFVTDSKGVSKQQTSDFSQIKKDSNINISCKFLSDGTLEGETVIILPATITTSK